MRSLQRHISETVRNDARLSRHSPASKYGTRTAVLQRGRDERWGAITNSMRVLVLKRVDAKGDIWQCIRFWK